MTVDLDNERPRRVPDFHLEARADENLLVDGDGSQLLLLNDSALALWELCDGTTTVREMVTAVVDLFHADSTDVQADVEATIRRLAEIGAVAYYRP